MPFPASTEEAETNTTKATIHQEYNGTLTKTQQN